MAQTDITYAYAADIVKTEKTEDGDLLVFGKAAGPELDMDGQICDPEWLKSAMPDWAKWGNVRAQHSAIAAGVGVELEDVGGGSWTLKSLVVDDDSKRKVEKRVYKGYSIGVKHAHVVKDARAPKGRIVAGDIVEISLVDRPANPAATMTLCKVAGGVPAPVDVDGELLGVLEPDLVKAARATVNGVLYGDLLDQLDEAGDVTMAKAAIDEICDLIVHEATVLKSAAADEVVSMEGLQEALEALESFTEPDDEGGGPDGYEGMEDDAAAYAAAMQEQEEALVDRVVSKLVSGDLFKRFFSQEEREDLADEGAAMDDGSYPIETRKDVINAVRLSGMGNQPHDKIKAHIIRRARAVDAEDLIPESWTTTTKAAASDAEGMIPATLLQAEITKAVAKATAAHQAELETLREQMAKAMAVPRSGGPYLITQAANGPAAKTPTGADRLRAIAARSDVSPDVAAAYRQRAEELEGASA